MIGFTWVMVLFVIQLLLVLILVVVNYYMRVNQYEYYHLHDVDRCLLPK